MARTTPFTSSISDPVSPGGEDVITPMLHTDEVRAVTQAAWEPRAAKPGKYKFCYTFPSAAYR